MSGSNAPAPTAFLQQGQETWEHFGQQAMSVKVQAKVNASIDYDALEEELFWQVQALRAELGKVEAAAWAQVKPEYDAQLEKRRQVCTR